MLKLYCFGGKNFFRFKAKFIVIGMMNCFKVCIFLENGTNKTEPEEITLETKNKDKNNMFPYGL